MNDLLSFRTMISPTLVKIGFWLGTISSFVVGALTLSNSGPFGPNPMIVFLTFFVAYPVGLRVWCEFVLIAFQVHSTLEEIRNNTARR